MYSIQFTNGSRYCCSNHVALRKNKKDKLFIAALKGAGIFNIGVTKTFQTNVMLFQSKQRHENQ